MNNKTAIEKFSEEDHQDLIDRVTIALSLMDLLWKMESRIENILDSYEIETKNEIGQILATACGDWASDRDGHEGAVQQALDEIFGEAEH